MEEGDLIFLGGGTGGNTFYWTADRQSALRNFQNTYNDHGFEAACANIKSKKEREYILHTPPCGDFTTEELTYLMLLDL